jgi:hypothetical protein
MVDEASSSLSWARWEKQKHRGLVALAILASALIASAPRNERRMFVLPHEPMAFAAISAPEPTLLRSAIMGYLNDGCGPDLTSVNSPFVRAVDERDCGKGRKRTPASAVREPTTQPNIVDPVAFLAVPDDPVVFDSTPLTAGSDLALTPLSLPDLGRGRFGGDFPPFFGPGNPAVMTSTTPNVLTGGVPEPASWALMIGGFVLAGTLLRRSARRVSFS